MAKPQHNRRDFLRGRAALAAAADAVEAVLDHHLGPPTGDPPPASRPVLTLARRAMACDFELRLGDGTAEAGMAALDVVDRVEDELTVYRDTSTLIELNRLAADEPVEVDDELFALLSLCDRVHRETDGAFDPTSGPLSRVWGFHRREGRKPSDSERAAALERVGWSGVELDAQQSTVRFVRDGIEVNANSIGKGYALDRAAETLAAHEVSHSLMHGGRSTLLARGDDPNLAGGGWRAGIRNPFAPEHRLAVFTLRDEALSTSGSGTQFFEQGGRRFGHLIDPRSGWPAEGLLSATVIAPTAAEADAFSTAAYILGAEGTARLAQRRPDLRFLLLAPTGEGTLQILPHNLPDACWRPPVGPNAATGRA